MTRWLVTGARGMLGTDLLDVLAARRSDDTVGGLDLPELDITDPGSAEAALSGVDVVVNCAAWTDVDGAETHEATAFSVNAIGAATLARACADTGARLLHLSTDYVFAGDSADPYDEDAPLAPRTAYGRTKAAGEWAVRAYLPERSWILRTAWLYGWHGKNFVDTILRLAAERDTVNVVDDQHGQPTWTVDLAHRIIDTVTSAAPPGVYHATPSGHTTWHGLARAAVALDGGDPDRVRPTTTAAFPRPAPRPAWSVLGHDRWAKADLPPLRRWDDALREAMQSRPARP
jgi:dTDP-4-dehydrorhamnose reductase